MFYIFKFCLEDVYVSLTFHRFKRHIVVNWWEQEVFVVVERRFHLVALASHGGEVLLLIFSNLVTLLKRSEIGMHHLILV